MKKTFTIILVAGSVLLVTLCVVVAMKIAYTRYRQIHQYTFFLKATSVAAAGLNRAVYKMNHGDYTNETFTLSPEGKTAALVITPNNATAATHNVTVTSQENDLSVLVRASFNDTTMIQYTTQQE
ncbi:MAG: hypothetical protein PHV55_07395 [Candidatus Omnitrophica bacterium]|nr:hypothetical protein [Candidatus Omnitrophota bacterium]